MRARARNVPVILALCAALLAPGQPFAHESPVDHVDRAIRIWIENGSLYVRYQVQLSERSATMQLGQMDTNRDGVISPAESDAFFTAAHNALAKELKVTLAGKALELKAEGRVELQPQFRQSYTFSAPVGALEKGRYAGEFTDHYSRNYPGAYKWDEPKSAAVSAVRIVVSEAPKMHAVDGHPSVLLIKFEAHVAGRALP